MWDKDKANKLEIELRTQLQENLMFLERYERIEADSIEIVLSKNATPKYEVSKAVGEAIYNAIKNETEEILIKLVIIRAGEDANIMTIFRRYASNYCGIHLRVPSLEAFEEHHCKFCSHSESCPYYLNDNDNYHLKADQELAQGYCNRQGSCCDCNTNSKCVYKNLVVDNQNAILGRPLADSLFVYKDSYVEQHFSTRWQGYVNEINSICKTDVVMSGMKLDL